MTTASNRRHWHCWVKSGRGMFMASVRLTAQEREDELPPGSRRVVRRWFTSRQAARKRGLKAGDDFVVLECKDPDCADAPVL